MNPKKNGFKPKKKLDMEFILRFYDAYIRTYNLAKVAAALEMSPIQIERRIEKVPELKEAQELADRLRSKSSSLSNFVFRSLTKEAQETWEKLQKSADNKETIQKIFSRKTKQIRQELFIHALVHSSYDLSTACRMVGMDRSALQKWKHDLEFLQLMEEIQWHKKNFFESALVQLVEERHPGAVMFVNRTLNADRGYSEKLQINHSGEINSGLSLAELDLDMETRKKVLQAIRLKKASAPKQIEGPTITLERAEER